MRSTLRLRRHDLAPRVEMLPMLDVIFLLLTFFIYSLLVMVRAEILPVQLVPVGTGEAAEAGTVEAITIDRAGQVYLNREPVADDALDARLAALAAMDEPPRLFLAMETTHAGEAAGPGTAVDRGPLLIELIQRVQGAGLYDFVIVGQPSDGGGGTGGTGGGGP
ncbi:MAG: biopolymer transporter ExbD [Phycisphaeraceae bacterium]